MPCWSIWPYTEVSLFNTAFVWFDAYLFFFLLLCFSYNGAITKCVTAIIVLQRKCKEYQKEGDEGQTSCPEIPVMGPPAKVRALKGPGARESSRSSSNETEQEVDSLFVE